MDFPRSVFTSPGPDTCQGGTYGFLLVQDEDEMKAALKAGFFESIPEALNATGKAALVKKAESLGITVNPKWSEKQLAAEIAEVADGV